MAYRGWNPFLQVGGGFDASGIPWQSMPASAVLTLPANGLLVFARDMGD